MRVHNNKIRLPFLTHCEYIYFIFHFIFFYSFLFLYFTIGETAGISSRQTPQVETLFSLLSLSLSLSLFIFLHRQHLTGSFWSLSLSLSLYVYVIYLVVSILFYIFHRRFHGASSSLSCGRIKKRQSPTLLYNVG